MEHQQSQQEQYLAVIKQIIVDNIDNESFSVEDLAREAGLSRSMLHRKLIRLTGKSATDLITEIRLKRAFELLENDAGTVSEIAYMVGYSSPSYFNKVFKKTYKVSPGDVRRKGRGKIPHLRVVKEPGAPVSARSIRPRLKVIPTTIILIITIVTLGALALILFNNYQRSLTTGNLRNIELTIAVLPFENWNTAEEFLYLGDAIASEITTQLAQIKEFQVTSFFSSSQFKGQDKPSISEIGKILGAKIIIVGSLERQEEDFNIQVQAIRTSNGKILWADLFTFKWEDISAIRANITISIAEGLKIAPSPEEEKQILSIGTQNSEAYNLYLKGNYLFREWSADACRKAIEVYKQAIALDSTYAQPYAGMAMAYFMLTSWEFEADTRLIPVARKWALKSLELDPNLGDPHYILGAISFIHEWDWVAAEKAFLIGMELNPNHVWGRSNYSNLLYLMRRFEEAIAISEYTLKLDPLDSTPYMELAGPSWCIGQKEKAIELNEKGQELFPDAPNFKRGLAYMYLEKGINYQFIYDYCNGLMEGDTIGLQKVPAFSLGDVGYFWAQMGHSDEALGILNELTRRVDAGEDDLSYMWMGLIYYLLGDTETAIDFLELSYEAREYFMFVINVVPEFNDEELRANPRFQALIRKLGFEI